MPDKKQINILLADDDKDDTFFFARALKKVSFATKIVALEDGEKLINYLDKKRDHLPDILFLDVNMPRKNGMECLEEIKANSATKDLPVVIYSTSLEDSVADVFYKKGALYYMKKGDFNDLVHLLEFVLTALKKEKVEITTRDNFILSPGKA